MGARLQLIYGDMFDGPTDLIVLPCSTAGTVTETVRRRLRAFAIPNPRRMKLGDVEFQQASKPLQQLASFFAFAASVEGYTSSLDSAQQIGHHLGSFAALNRSILQVSAPLLGAGAGGLQPQDVIERLTKGFLNTAPEETTLKIFILDRDIYEQLDSALSSRSTGISPDEIRPDERKESGAFVPIRVFISYTQTSDEHQSWVKDLAVFLRQNGIDARLDQWHLVPGQDVAQWMCNEVELADRVLMICNEEYAMRADGRHGGVGWEIRLIQGYLLQEGANNPSKFVPIVCTLQRTDGLPSFLRGTYFVHWPQGRQNDDPSLRTELVKLLYKVTDEAPPIGRPPSFVIQALEKRLSPGELKRT